MARSNTAQQREQEGETGSGGIVWMGEMKGGLCKEVRCHHILINLYLGGAGTTAMERRLDVGSGATVYASVSHMVCPCRSSSSQRALLHPRMVVAFGMMKFLVYLNCLQ